MHQRARLTHAGQRVDPAEPAPEVRVVQDPRAVQLHPNVIDRVVAVERREKPQIRFGEIAQKERPAIGKTRLERAQRLEIGRKGRVIHRLIR